jgi:hypothetical protein
MTYGKVFLLGFFMLATAALYAWFGPSRYHVIFKDNDFYMVDVYSEKYWKKDYAHSKWEGTRVRGGGVGLATPENVGHSHQGHP